MPLVSWMLGRTHPMEKYKRAAQELSELFQATTEPPTAVPTTAAPVESSTATVAAATTTLNPFEAGALRFLDEAGAALVTIVKRAIYALIVLIVGIIIIKILLWILARAFRARKWDETVTKYISEVVRFFLNALLFIVVMNILGVNMVMLGTILAALAVSLGWGVGLLVSNFVAGFLILSFKPFVRGDFVDSGGVTGTVEEIGAGNVVLSTPDNRRVLVPNQDIIARPITNYSVLGVRRVDLTVAIAAEDDADVAIRTMMNVMLGHKDVLTTPECVVRMTGVSNGRVMFSARPYVKGENYWSVWSDMLEQFAYALGKKGFQAPRISLDAKLASNSRATAVDPADLDPLIVRAPDTETLTDAKKKSKKNKVTDVVRQASDKAREVVGKGVSAVKGAAKGVSGAISKSVSRARSGKKSSTSGKTDDEDVPKGGKKSEV